MQLHHHSTIVKGFFLYLLAISLAAGATPASNITVSHLTCEYLQNPLGIDKTNPLLGWRLYSTQKGIFQSSYQILVAAGKEALDKNIGDVWDSGKINSSESQNVRYAGPQLKAGQHYFWKVRIWDASNNISAWSPVAYWSVGPLSPGDWKGKWISNKYANVSAERSYMGTWGKDKAYTSPDTAAIYLRRVFEAKKEVKNAVAYISGLGYYELYVNGEKAGDRVLDPVFTDYQKQVNYVTYDITSSIKSGKNAIGVILGNGFYNSPTADLFQMESAHWKTSPKLIFDLHIEYADGAKTLISSDDSWKWNTGEIIYNSIRGGETIDHRNNEKGWNTASFNDQHWRKAIVVPPPTGELTAQYIPPMCVNEVIKPEKISEPVKGVYIVDFGKNITGWMSLKVKGTNGQKIQCWYNEVLKDDGTLNKEHSSGHTRGRFQKEEFILNGEGTEYFDPRFTYHGFRYVQLEGLSAPPGADDINAKSVHTSLDTIGSFRCSDEQLNNLHAAVQRTLLNSMHGMPAEEPTREKMGWTLDAWVTMESYLYNFEAINAYKKSLRDYMDAQEPSGHIASIVPTNGWAYLTPEGKPIYFDDPWWGGTIFLITDKLFAFTGDTAIISQAFDALRAYVDFISTTAKDDIVNWSLGDWLDLTHNEKGPGLTPVEQTSTAAYYWMSYRLSEFAEIIGKKDVAAQYAKQAQRIREKFNAAFLDRSTGWYKKYSQTAQVLPLYLGITPEEMKQKVEEKLYEAVFQNNNHVSAGFIGVLPLLNYLSLNDMPTAYEMVTKKESPGWLHMVKNAKNTLGENLNSRGYGTGHHPYGAHIGFWLFKYLGGIRPDERNPGFKQFIIAPQFVHSLNWLETETESLYGKIHSSWKRRENHIELKVTVPGNTKAQLILPDSFIVVSGTLKGNDFLLGSGDYTLILRNNYSKTVTEPNTSIYTVYVDSAAVAIRTNHLKFGTNSDPSGQLLGANNFYFTKNNKPWYPVMGEFHFSRYPRTQWKESILKMKAAGIEVIASYVFWIYHEEDEGMFDWTGNRDLRAFVELCKKNDLYFFARIGPWCHGEVRNGGFPDWLAKKGNTRKNDEWYLKKVKRFYDEIGNQLRGLYFKNGGAVIGAQIENEYSFANHAGLEHMLTLKKMAIEAGIDVPYYTATGWPASDQQQTEFIPVWGAYPEAPWESNKNELPLLDSYLFGPLRNDPAIGNDILGDQQQAIVDLKGYPYPYATAEMGGGNQITYHRRPVIDAPDVTALSYVKIGSGANLMGYYVFHGGSNPIGKRSTLQESKATKYPNDYPIISYDFYAPVGEWGQLRQSYRSFKVLHSFLNEFGDLLAPCYPFFPDRKPQSPADNATLRMAVRSRDNRGFIFISNFQRQLEMKDLENIQFKLCFHNNTTLTLPSKPTTIKSGIQMILPFNMNIMGATLTYATAQPLCRLGDSVFVFFARDGIAPEFVFEKKNIDRIEAHANIKMPENSYAVDKLQPGINCVMKIKLKTGSIVQIITLTQSQALDAWKVEERGREYLIISKADIEDDKNCIAIKHTNNPEIRLHVFPDMNARFSTGEVKTRKDGIFTHYQVSITRRELKIAAEEIKDLRPYQNHGKAITPDDRLATPDSTKPGPQYQTNLQMVEGSRNWIITPKFSSMKGLSDAFIIIDYLGDTGAAYADGKLIADDFYAGLPMKIGMKRFSGKLKEIVFQVVPLTETRNIYFESEVRNRLKGKTVAGLNNVAVVPQYTTTLTVK